MMNLQVASQSLLTTFYHEEGNNYIYTTFYALPAILCVSTVKLFKNLSNFGELIICISVD